MAMNTARCAFSLSCASASSCGVGTRFRRACNSPDAVRPAAFVPTVCALYLWGRLWRLRPGTKATLIHARASLATDDL